MTTNWDDYITGEEGYNYNSGAAKYRAQTGWYYLDEDAKDFLSAYDPHTVESYNYGIDFIEREVSHTYQLPLDTTLNNHLDWATFNDKGEVERASFHTSRGMDEWLANRNTWGTNY